jgi:hypothetical protein
MLFCDGSQGVFGALSSLISLQTLQIEFLYSNNNQLFSNDLLALCNLHRLTMLYIYHGYATEPLDCAFTNMLACLSNLKTLTFYLNSETDMLKHPLQVVAKVGQQLESLTVSGIHSIDINLEDEDQCLFFPFLQLLYVGSWDVPGSEYMR